MKNYDQRKVWIDYLLGYRGADPRKVTSLFALLALQARALKESMTSTGSKVHEVITHNRGPERFS